jgi:hypothetical protein
MGEEEVSRLMQQSLDEEHEADKALTTLAMQTINHQAARQSDEDEEESSKDFDPDEAYGVSKGNSKRRKKARRNT